MKCSGFTTAARNTCCSGSITSQHTRWDCGGIRRSKRDEKSGQGAGRERKFLFPLFFEVDDANRDEIWSAIGDCVRDCCRDGRVACGWRQAQRGDGRERGSAGWSGGYCGLHGFIRRGGDGEGAGENTGYGDGDWRFGVSGRVGGELCVLRQDMGKRKKQDAAGARKS